MSDGTSFTYDNNGNLIQKSDGTDTWEYIYDDGCSCNNRLTEIKLNGQTIGRYWYDGDGKRIKKLEDSKTTIYIYSGIKVIYEKVIKMGVETKYIGSVTKIENGVTTYYHVD
ncbi:MAG: hypothetical protein ACE5HW_04990, partial [Candidatus Methanofastidiosia archaeon]